MVLKYTCKKCKLGFEKEVPNRHVEVMCPICGTKQKFRYKTMDGNGNEKWQEADPWDDPDYWQFP